jgi:uncharacterized protein (DUF2461 family)
LWCPERDHLARLRSSIDRHPRRWRRALNNQTFRDVFFPAVKPSTGEDGVVDAFAERNKDTALKKRPQGYDMEHRDIRLLRLRNFVVGKNIDDTLLCRDDAQEKVAEVLRGLEPFVTFLNSIVMPDPSLDNDDSSSEEGEGDDGEDED